MVLSTTKICIIPERSCFFASTAAASFVAVFGHDPRCIVAAALPHTRRSTAGHRRIVSSSLADPFDPIDRWRAKRKRVSSRASHEKKKLRGRYFFSRSTSPLRYPLPCQSVASIICPPLGHGANKKIPIYHSIINDPLLLQRQRSANETVSDTGKSEDLRRSCLEWEGMTHDICTSPKRDPRISISSFPFHSFTCGRAPSPTDQKAEIVKGIEIFHYPLRHRISIPPKISIRSEISRSHLRF